MNNKDRMALSRFAAAFEEYAKEDKSKAAKELRAEREAWEKSAGGAKVLANAEATAQGIVSRAKADSDRIAAATVQAEGEAGRVWAEQNAALQKSKAELAERERFVTARSINLDEQEQAIEKANRQVQARETGVADVGAALANREADIDAREASVFARETEVDRKFAALRTALG